MINLIVGLLIFCLVGLLGLIIYQLQQAKAPFVIRDNFLGGGIGLVADFLDTLGVGSFVTTTTLFQVTNYLDDERNLPGTMNVAHAIPTITEALFFVTVVKVDITTLVAMVLAAIVGAVIGSEVVVRLDQAMIQRIMAIALIVTSILMAINKMGWVSIIAIHNNAMGLTGWLLAIGVGGNFILGMLMAAGVGLYAPCMVLVYFLGLKPIAAFPIMMLSCALLMPAVSLNFMRTKRYSLRGMLGFIIGGIIGVVIAATVVKSLPLAVLGWLIVAVSCWTAYQLWRSSVIQSK
ncbi:TSUP family transporter [Paucilactobacillus wasatchensis]|uniref:Probable membrane transporter protein n=1 Tax=Paucilactobacillus wasatchensis TaxID=1335616 RepID=A0A0D1AB55_9LACO|nr:TSUP family transporter [Paucilactobacillus wasatchensis]KIS03951.1 integral membrane protein [Paucilactobacillus wasatchensis]